MQRFNLFIFLLFCSFACTAQSINNTIKTTEETYVKHTPTKEDRLKEGYSMCKFLYNNKKYTLYNRSFTLTLNDGTKSYQVEKMPPLDNTASYTAQFNAVTHCIEVQARSVINEQIVLNDKNVLRRFNFPIERIIAEKNYHAKHKKKAPTKKIIPKKV